MDGQDTYRIEVTFEVRAAEGDLAWRVCVVDPLGEVVGGPRSCFASSSAGSSQRFEGTIVFEDGQAADVPAQAPDVVDRYLEDIDAYITRRGLDMIRRRLAEVSPAHEVAERLETLPRTFVVPEGARAFIRRHL